MQQDEGEQATHILKSLHDRSLNAAKWIQDYFWALVQFAAVVLFFILVALFWLGKKVFGWRHSQTSLCDQGVNPIFCLCGDDDSRAMGLEESAR